MSELTDLRRRVRQAIQDARQKAAARRVSRDDAAKAWAAAIAEIVEPVAANVAAAMTGEGLAFKLETPRGSVRIVSDRSPGDYIEVVLDDADEREAPEVIGRTVRGRGRQSVTVIEELLGPPAQLSEDRVIAFFMGALAPFA